MSDVSLRNLVKRYGPVTAVNDVSLEIAEGEFFSLLGPSGCGKSTTLRMIAGFEDVSSGEIRLDGEDVSGLPPERREIGFVFQNYAIFPHMNVFENIAFGLRLRKLRDDRIKSRVSDVLSQVGMEGLGARMQSEMSGGQQQRVALARVLVTEPKILLLDEPLSALDKNLREEMKFWIKDLQSSVGITTIYVTHDQGEALTMSDQIAVMSDGEIAQVGTPKEIYEAPENLFVAGFIGESSVLSGSVVSTEGEHCSVSLDGATVSARRGRELSRSDTASIVLRPEHVRIGPASEEGDWIELPAMVKSITYQGATLRFACDAAGQEVVSEMTNGPEAPDLSVGEAVILRWRRDAGVALPVTY